ncbi:class I SAM-dependent methyltransferase [Ktedonosporobacter rubrisoli]|uniref:Class I SAM-dependent methyltransferase n=1 Tax=Ktedonosporobacter rubrisoli TaxID=2509675 RepID=A0A4V0YYG4_KTERU|nr:class I SAM-dependent methyltransferase [Ktedonosporobacter rubrisoli]QBD76131.1 class I SAM-dependent methyltransferase [Ktedonosporobacter rubrisoli]
MTHFQDDHAFFEYLLHEYNQPFSGWDFSYLKGRREELQHKLAWDYTAIALTAMRQAQALLDMHTGGGEQLARLLAQQPVAEVYATEGYQPNIELARQRLEPLGVSVSAVNDARLPFADEQLDLILNRHGDFAAHEVKRVLKSGKLFITQQVGDQTNRRLHEVLDPPAQNNASGRPAWNLSYAVREMQEAGWHILEQREDTFTTRFYDVGAIVYYLKAIPWEIPGFSVERYFERLLAVRDLIEHEGPLDVAFHSFLIVARKP